MLATLPDYEVRYGPADDGAQVEALLADASSLVRQASRQAISRVTDDVELHEGDGSDLLCLRQLPVVEISSIDVDGVTLAADAWRLLPHGQVRRVGGVWTCDRPVEVTYTHGHDLVPEWIVSLVCTMVQRATRPEALAGVQQQTTGSQSVAFVSTGAGANVWLTQADVARLERIVGPVVA